jgi:DNA-binding beta-propeller fold protein YncE
VTTSGDVYVDTFDTIGGVSKWTLNSTSGVPTMYTCQRCWDLFVDINNTLYCSISSLAQVVTKSLNSNSNALTIVAGIGVPGSAPNMLQTPRAIFVDINFDLYVADCDNDRIQLFRSGELNGTTVVGSGSPTVTITLSRPTGIALDADKYIYIVEWGNNRVIGSGPYGFQCLVGCSGQPGSTASELNYPFGLSFDSYGNMFVTDSGNSRIQKFILVTDLCGKLNKDKNT